MAEKRVKHPSSNSTKVQLENPFYSFNFKIQKSRRNYLSSIVLKKIDKEKLYQQFPEECQISIMSGQKQRSDLGLELLVPVTDFVRRLVVQHNLRRSELQVRRSDEVHVDARIGDAFKRRVGVVVVSSVKKAL